MLVTIVNRGLTDLMSVEVVLNDASFSGQANVRVLTEGTTAPAEGPVPGLARVKLDEGTQGCKGDRLVLNAAGAVLLHHRGTYRNGKLDGSKR